MSPDEQIRLLQHFFRIAAVWNQRADIAGQLLLHVGQQLHDLVGALATSFVHPPPAKTPPIGIQSPLPPLWRNPLKIPRKNATAPRAGEGEDGLGKRRGQTVFQYEVLVGVAVVLPAPGNVANSGRHYNCRPNVIASSMLPRRVPHYRCSRSSRSFFLASLCLLVRRWLRLITLTSTPSRMAWVRQR